MLRKLFVTLAGAGISDPYLQIIAALMILIISFGLQSFFQPYEPIALDVLDSLGIFCLLCTQILSILYLYVDTSNTLVVNKTILEYGVTFGLFLINGVALASFVGGYIIAYLQLDCRSLRCKKREMLWLVEDVEVFERELEKQPGEIDEGGAAEGAENEEAGRVVYIWKHPTNGKVMTWPPKCVSKADDGTAQDHWIWFDENGNPEGLSFEAPQLFERAPIEEKREPHPGDRTCLFDVKRMEATPLREVPHDLGGFSIFCKRQATRAHRGAPAAAVRVEGGVAFDGNGIVMGPMAGDPLRDDRVQALPRANFDNPMHQQQALERVNGDPLEEEISELELGEPSAEMEAVADGSAMRVSMHGNPMHQPQALDEAAASDLDLDISQSDKKRRGSHFAAKDRRRLKKRERLDTLKGSALPIPAGWTARTSTTSGKQYFHHRDSGQTSWIHPASDHTKDRRQLKKREREETRADDDDGIYTRSQFIEHYGGTAEWDAAETREGEDGFKYTQTQFIEHYGGTAEWDSAEGKARGVTRTGSVQKATRQ